MLKMKTHTTLRLETENLADLLFVAENVFPETDFSHAWKTIGFALTIERKHETQGHRFERERSKVRAQAEELSAKLAQHFTEEEQW